jgi:hypothetical protein
MPIYEGSVRTTLVTASAMAPLFAIRGSTTRPTFLKEIGLFGITAPTTSGAVGLCRSTALGTGALTSVAPIARDLSSATAGAVLVTAWATLAPTVGAASTVFRRWAQPASIGNGVIWRFDDDDPHEMPLGSAVNGELVLVNLQATAPGTFDIYVVLME